MQSSYCAVFPFPLFKKGKLQPHQKRNAEREGEKNKNSWNPEGGSNQTVQMPTIMEPHNQQQQEENNSFIGCSGRERGGRGEGEV